MSRTHVPIERAALTNRNGAIDALRGFAALMVVFNHLSNQSTFAIGNLGMIGVLLFFIISGYCMFLAVNKYSQERLRYFLVKRFFRLYPAYWASIITFLVVSSEKYDATTVLYNFTMVQRLFSVPNIIGLYWTLFVEIIFYSIIVLLILFDLISRREIVLRFFYGFIILTIFAAGVRYTTTWDMPFAHFLFMATFMLGGVFFFNEQTRQTSTNSFFHAAAFLACTWIVSWLVYNDATTGVGEMDKVFDTLSYFGNYLFATSLFLIGTLILRINTRITSYLGAISYSVYLFHIIVMVFLRPFISSSSISSNVWSLALIILTAAFVHHVVEKPFIKLGDNILKRQET